MVLYIVLRGRCYDIIVLNARSPIKDKSDDSKGGLYEEPQQEFNHFPQCHIKTIFGDLSAKFVREGILKLLIWNGSLREDCKENGVGIVNFFFLFFPYRCVLDH
jgi:hypothetical protein